MQHRCPVCGAAIADGSAMCSVCKAGVCWPDGQPSASLEGKYAYLFWKLTFLVIATAALLLFVYWLLH